MYTHMYMYTCMYVYVCVLYCFTSLTIVVIHFKYLEYLKRMIAANQTIFFSKKKKSDDPKIEEILMTFFSAARYRAML